MAQRQPREKRKWLVDSSCRATWVSPTWTALVVGRTYSNRPLWLDAFREIDYLLLPCDWPFQPRLPQRLDEMTWFFHVAVDAVDDAVETRPVHPVHHRVDLSCRMFQVPPLLQT